MAAYAALVSLENIIHNLQNHSRPPITLHQEQAHLLTQKLIFLQEFLQVYNPSLPYSKEADPLEARIAGAAYEAEDAIESHIFDKLNNNDGGNMSLDSLYRALKKVIEDMGLIGGNMSLDSLYRALEKVIEDMGLIEKEAMEIRETLEFNNQLQTKSTPPADSSRSAASSTAKIKSMMVGADDLLLEMKDKLTSNARDLQTFPIVGMGGSGKTTLALNIFQDGLIKERFDIRGWVTISQEYNILEILIQLLTQLTGEPNRELSEGELGEMLHKHLYGRKYMIILDDIWSVEAWDGVKRYLPNNKNGSRIVITTRLTNLASTLSNSNSLGMKLLDEDDSWDLLSKTVFGEKVCPLELEDIGKKIGKSCKGLPLSIVVVGGLLAKSEQSIESWEHMEGNLNAIVNLEDDKRCLKILYMSYKQLPVHLKPCFLYMGIYSEDHEIGVSKLIKLWVAEGFLKPVNGKRLEDVGRAHLKDLIDRNLILVHKVSSIGSIKKCKVHDLLRDLCLREAQKEWFYTVCPGHEINDEVSRIVKSRTMHEITEIDALSSSVPRARSLIWNHGYNEVPPHIFRMLRIVCSDEDTFDEFEENVHQLVNLRFFRGFFEGSELPSFIWLLWNLQTLIVNDFRSSFMFTVPDDIWHMSHIRHLDINNFYLPDPPPNVQANDIVLANLQSLGRIMDFTCSEQMVKRIPNIRKLNIYYEEGVDDRFCLTNLDCLNKLETLICTFSQSMCLINYPQSLKKLTLYMNDSSIYCQDILDKIGALPLLEKLKLWYFRTLEGQWETTEGQFRSLKFLGLKRCKGMQVWKSEASHFPRLEQLHLDCVRDLEEVPLDFAEISTLRLIDIRSCNVSVVEWAKRILEEQETLYGEEETTLQIKALHCRSEYEEYEALEGFKSPNFQLTLFDSLVRNLKLRRPGTYLHGEKVTK